MMRAAAPPTCLALAACLLAGGAGAEILVKGLTDGSAILLIDERLTILRVGESRGGVTLLRADNDAAVLQIDGRRVTLELDRSIAETYQPPQPERTRRAGTEYLYRHRGTVRENATQLLSVKLVDEGEASVALGVEYVYVGDYGQDVYLTATTLRNSADTGHATQEETRLLPGKHYIELLVASDTSAPLVYVSDALKLTVAWRDQGAEQGAITSRVIPFSKYWKKVSVR